MYHHILSSSPAPPSSNGASSAKSGGEMWGEARLAGRSGLERAVLMPFSSVCKKTFYPAYLFKIYPYLCRRF
jgi:hypothetical protein